MRRRNIVRSRGRRRNGRTAMQLTRGVNDSIVRVPFREFDQFTTSSANLHTPQGLLINPETISDRLSALALSFSFYRYTRLRLTVSFTQANLSSGVTVGNSVALSYSNDINGTTPPGDVNGMAEQACFRWRRQNYGDDGLVIDIPRRELVTLQPTRWWATNGTISAGGVNVNQGKLWFAFPDATASTQSTSIWLQTEGTIEFCGPQSLNAASTPAQLVIRRRRSGQEDDSKVVEVSRSLTLRRTSPPDWVEMRPP